MLSTKIAFNDVGIKAFQLKKRLLSRISSVIDTGQFLHGKENNILSTSLSNFFKLPYVEILGSGHDALLFSIQSLKLSLNDEVIVPANAYPTVFPLALSGIKIKLCDVDENGQMSIDCLKKTITKKTAAIILVHMFGLTTKVDEVANIAKKNKIFLIEDCAQSFGTKYNNQLVGTFGDVACFSFYPTKNLGTLGDGGAVVTKHKNIALFIHRAKAYGEDLRYKSGFVSGHSRLPELQAATLNVYFETRTEDFNKRKKIFAYYKEKMLKRLSSHIRILTSHTSSDPVPHLLVIEGERRNDLAKYLAKSGIEIHIHYPLPIHLVEAFSYLGYKSGNFPMAEKLSKNTLSLPFHAFITKKHVDFIVDKIKEFYEKTV